MSEAQIRVERVTKIYGSNGATTTALADVYLDVARGEWVAIMGPSGHGKSTLLQIMGGLDRPTEGSIHLNGTEMTALGPDELAQTRAREIGFVFQFFNLLPHLTALENVQLALWFGGTATHAARQRSLDLLDAVGLADKAALHPSALSGGQQQRVAVARALANDPKTLLMDEPTGNLDSVAENELLELLKRLHAEGKTIVMVTHNPEVADHAQRIVRVKDGRINEDRVNGS
ncbi:MULTISPECIES: ABC transporter ATP-binding protein [Vibrio harveyi group]|uniref:ABC transporter ATP-binding protein n=1 Tax=Vibrio harveyi group TaxID=717610 RepID=UPI001F0822A4|nr:MULTISPECIES: ABC transporter ATP-binding protein [Vibrio harveyi group]MEA5376650.1 ABC transporter ATP-binding protein [Vibrio parahaemolyticus]UMM06724.1 ABC transporter ATP-binding protein [Vibrio campbellii]